MTRRTCVTALTLALGGPAPAGANTFVVNDFGDTDNGGVCAAPCTLRDAINASNTNPGADTITFSGPGTVAAGASVPAILESVTIDGTLGTAGARQVTLHCQAGGTGLELSAGVDVVKGLAIQNCGYGILTDGTSQATISDNSIGTNAAGDGVTADSGNTQGMLLQGSGHHVTGNVIAGNVSAQIGVAGDDMVIAGNRIGTDASGKTPLGPETTSIGGTGTNVVIGGPTAADRNVIFGQVTDNGSNGGKGWTIQNNAIGIDATGRAVLPHAGQVGTTWNVALLGTSDSQDLVIGNVIGGAPLDGIYVWGGAHNDQIRDNAIGTDRTGRLALGNGGPGIGIYGAPDNIVGPGNVIAHNTGVGVFVQSLSGSPAVHNRITANRIFANGAQAIDLWTTDTSPLATPNDAADTDTGSNDLQNFPVVTAAVGGSPSTIIGTLDSAAMGAYRVELLSGSACKADSGAAAERYLGFVDVTTDTSGHATFSTTVPSDVTGETVSATATDADGNTSELSPCQAATGPPVLGHTVVVAAERGKVLVRKPGNARFAPLSRAGTVPVGSTVDAIGGQVGLVAARDTRRHTQKASFWQGRFTVRQDRHSHAVTDLVLPMPSCGAQTRSAVTAKRHHPPHHKTALWGHGTGDFRSHGSYGTATVTGTFWYTENRCDGTLVRVRQGRVRVLDIGLGRTTIVTTGHSYLARRR